MQVTKGTWCMREQCVPGSLSSSHARELGNEAKNSHTELQVTLILKWSAHLATLEHMPCLHSTFDGYGTSLQHQLISLNTGLCMLFLLLYNLDIDAYNSSMAIFSPASGSLCIIWPPHGFNCYKLDCASNFNLLQFPVPRLPRLPHYV